MFVGLGSQRFARIRLRDFLGCLTLVHYYTVGLEALEELRQLGTGELPFKRPWLLVREHFIEAQTPFDLLETGKVVGREDLPLHDREVDFHLVEPTGMHGSMHQNQIGVRLGQSTDRCVATMRRAIIDEPAAARRRAVGLPLHHLGNQATERHNARRRFTPPHDDSTPDIPGGQVLQRAAPLVLVFAAHRPLGGWWQAGMPPETGLDTGFLIGTEERVFGTERFALPGTGVEVQDAPSLLRKAWIAGKAPVAIAPGLDSVSGQK